MERQRGNDGKLKLSEPKMSQKISENDNSQCKLPAGWRWVKLGEVG